MVSRRQFLIGAQSALLAATAGRAYGGAPETSLFPQPRSTDLIRRSIPPLADVIADAGLPGRVGCAVADAETGEMLEVFNALYPHAAGQRGQGGDDGLRARPPGSRVPLSGQRS
jgi:hypothetical protein